MTASFRILSVLMLLVISFHEGVLNAEIPYNIVNPTILYELGKSLYLKGN